MSSEGSTFEPSSVVSVITLSQSILLWYHHMMGKTDSMLCCPLTEKRFGGFIIKQRQNDCTEFTFQEQYYKLKLYDLYYFSLYSINNSGYGKQLLYLFTYLFR